MSGVLNQAAAYPYASRSRTNGLRTCNRARNTLSTGSGNLNRPHVPTMAAMAIATSTRASSIDRNTWFSLPCAPWRARATAPRSGQAHPSPRRCLDAAERA